MTKIDIISGFLGAGKTTLIKKILLDNFLDERVFLIENDYGDVSIDSDLLRETNIVIKEILQGCICCSLSGDFSIALSTIIDQYKPDRIIIEPSGISKLADILKEITSISRDIVINSCSTVVDIKKINIYMKNYKDFYINQIEYANYIFLSRVSDASSALLKKGTDLIKSINPNCTIILDDWYHLNGKEILNIIEHKYNKKIEEAPIKRSNSLASYIRSGIKYNFENWCVKTTRAYTTQELEKIFDELNKEEYGIIVRAKGIIIVNNVWSCFNYVPGENKIEAVSNHEIGEICVIGIKINRDMLSKLFDVN